MKALSFYVIHDHNFSYLLIYMDKMDICGAMCAFLGYFREKTLPVSRAFYNETFYRNVLF